MGMNEWRESVGNIAKFKAFLSLLGKRQKTTLDAVGYFSNIQFSATIYYQEYDGAKNYHTCAVFNFAMAEVIKDRLGELMQLAQIRLEEIEREEGKNAEQDVLSALAQIRGGKK
jgi:hypothetical protein